MLYFGERSSRRITFLSTVAVVTALTAGVASAQQLRNAAGPAELPPASYTANQYIDSRGCAFVRAGISGTTQWVPRVSHNREQLCGFAPSALAQLPPPPAAAPAPEPAPQVAAAPSPRVIMAPEPAAPRVLTLAAACDGRTGIQAGLISQRTGLPIDCGPVPVAQTIPTAAPTTASAPTVTTTSQPRLSRAAACADTAATGRQYIGAVTGRPLDCGGQFGGLPALTADASLPVRPYSNPLDVAPGALFSPSVNTRNVPNCGYAPAADGSYAGGCDLRVQTAPTEQAPAIVSRALTAQTFGQRTPPPYSNPHTPYALAAPVVPDGYERVWGDGRLNTQRGIPAATAYGVANTVRYATTPRAAQPQGDQTARVSTRTAPQTTMRTEQLSGHRYVQVATFASRDQAQSVARSLRNRGLPMRVGVFNQGGRELRMVLAGPFANSTQLQSALSTARGAGYAGAFTRQ